MAKRNPKLAALEDTAECRGLLLDIVDRNIERLEEILKTHEENADTEAERVVAREGFDTGPRGKQLHDYELKYDRALRQGLATFDKLTGGRPTTPPVEPWRPPPYGTKTDEYCMGPSGKPAGRARSVSAGYEKGSNEPAPATSFAAGGSGSEPVGSGGEGNREATGLAADGSRSEPATVGSGGEWNWEATELAADGSGSEPVTLGVAERGWESVKVEAEDVLTCHGLLPERCSGLQDADPRVSAEDAAQEHRGPVGADVCEDVERVAEECAEGENATNEPKLDRDVSTIQSKENIEVVANSDAFSGLDTLRTNPRPGCGWREDEGPNLKSEILQSKPEGDRDLADIGDEQHRLDVGSSTVLSNTVAAGAGLVVVISCGEGECGSEHPVAAAAGCRPRANPPPPPAAVPPPQGGRNAGCCALGGDPPSVDQIEATARPGEKRDQAGGRGARGPGERVTWLSRLLCTSSSRTARRSAPQLSAHDSGQWPERRCGCQSRLAGRGAQR